MPSLSDQSGYATPAALVLSLALAVVASAMIERSVGLLRLSKADLALMQTEYGMSGAQLAAAAEVVRSQQPGPYHWASTTALGWVDILAEPELGKLDLASASMLDDVVIGSFGVRMPSALKAKLAQAAASSSIADVGAMDPAPLWRACASTMISTYGRQTVFVYAPRSEPGAIGGTEPRPPSWHIGETWRIRVTTTTGWRDDRIVRFTGDARHPAAVVVRTLSRGEGDRGQCQALLEAASRG